MINPYYFIEQKLKTGFKFNLESHIVFHAISILSITPIYSDFGIETKNIIKILNEMAYIYDRLMNQ